MYGSCMDKSDSNLGIEVERIKRRTIEYKKRVRLICVILLSAGVVAGVAFWFAEGPHDRTFWHSFVAMTRTAVGAVGCGLGTFFVGGLLIHLLFPEPSALCPQCGCDWTNESGIDKHKWLTWHSCPRCKLEMAKENDEPDRLSKGD